MPGRDGAGPLGQEIAIGRKLVLCSAYNAKFGVGIGIGC